ncbi:MAG: S-layer homology domain-containing protein, partial [Syntrophomonadaceae bacterium]|nr:S-layer homology domain-containing protein [Syntrophomonadaceae bacterium]
SDFSSGTFEGRKYYTINRNQGKLTITVSGGEVGYDNFWGNTQTQIIDYYLDSTRTIEADDEEERDWENSWQGMVRAYVSDSTAKSLRYEDNTAVYSSFAGAHMRVTNEEMTAIYEYDLPRIDTEGIPNNNRRDVYSVDLSKQMVPKIEKLLIPKFRDLGGHWAEDHISQLYSLDVFNESSAFFAPDIPMSRIDFIEAVVKACDIRPSNSQTNARSSTRRREPPEVSPYYDLDAANPAYAYIKTAVEKGITSGTSSNSFSPDDNLTKAQAVTILIRALGFENIAPTPGYQTSFYDNDQIPLWGIDSVYMGQRIGLVSGDTFNRLNPNQAVTKAEAAVMLVRFLNFLHEDLQKDYRDNIVLFR